MVDFASPAEELRHIFQEVEQGNHQWGDYSLREGGTKREEGRAWFGVDHQGNLAALFEVPPSTSMEPYWISRVIEVSPRQIRTPLGEEIGVIRVLCTEPNLVDVFPTFISDVMHRETDATPIIQAVGLAAADWRGLISHAPRGLTDEEALGLFGELRFLEELAQQVGPGALEHWTENRHDRHDFSGSRGAVEVKATRRQDSSTVTIHGLTQLLPPEDGFLALVVAEVDSGGTGEALDDVLTRLDRMGCDSFRLRRAMYDRGWVPVSEESPPPAAQKFSLRGWRWWVIDDLSPVLNTATLPAAVADAVSGLSYRLSLAALGRETVDIRPSDLGVVR